MGVKRWLVGLVAAGSMLGLAGVSVAPAQAADLPFERLAGPSGVETSLAVAKHTWGSTWPVVYVASNRNPVDALPAATIGDGPVVLTDGKSLNLGGVKPGKIMILGGLGAVPQAIEDQAKGQGVEVIRLAGANRNATAVAIAKQWVKVNGTPKNVYVTKNVGSGSPDAVAASVLRDGPILTFTNDASAAALPGVVSELKAPKVTALGGTAVVPDSVLNTAAGGKATARLAGANRYETAFTIAKYAKAQKSGSVVYLASGTALKDAMVAGAAKDGVILLSPANGEGVKAKADALGASKLMIIGGTGVMPDATVKAAATGVIPKAKSAADMSMDEMRASLTKADAATFKYRSDMEYFMMAPKPSPKGDYLVGAAFAEGPYLLAYFPSWEPTGLTAENMKHGQCYPNNTSVRVGGIPCDSFPSWQEVLNMSADPTRASASFGWDGPGFYQRSVTKLGNIGGVIESKLWYEKDSGVGADPHKVARLQEGQYIEALMPEVNLQFMCGASGGTMKCFEWFTDDSEPSSYQTRSNPVWLSFSYK